MSAFSISILVMIALTGLQLYSEGLKEGDDTKEKKQSYKGVVGGVMVPITEAPFVATFRWISTGKVECGGCIVHVKFIVLAAQCVKWNNMSYFHINVGTDVATGGQNHTIFDYYIHPNASTFDYELAMIKVTEDFVVSDTVKPIEMADKDTQVAGGQEVETFGFGYFTDKKRITTYHVLKLVLQTVDPAECNATMTENKARSPITEAMICAGGESGKTVCKGNAGGALRMGELLIGTDSWGRCEVDKLPVVFANLAAHREFIDETIAENP